MPQFNTTMRPEHGLLGRKLWDSFTTYLSKHTNVESRPRITGALEQLVPTIRRSAISSLETLDALGTWFSTCLKSIIRIFNDTRAKYLKCPHATPFLGKASRGIYKYVREQLAVPFFGEEFISSAEWEELVQVDDGTGTGVNESTSRNYHSMGEMITAVYESMRSGAFYAVAVDCLKDLFSGS